MHIAPIIFYIQTSFLCNPLYYLNFINTCVLLLLSEKLFKSNFFGGFKKISVIYLSTLKERQRQTNGQADTQRKTEKKKKKKKGKEPTRIMNLIAAHPEVAMTFALLGTRLKSVGTMASAP